MIVVDVNVPSELVMKKVAASACSAYDCECIALAEDLKTTLVTCDRQILAEFPTLATGLKEFAGAGPPIAPGAD